jgi:hypothetical protein
MGFPMKEAVEEKKYSNRTFIGRVGELKLLRAFVWSEGIIIPSSDTDEYAVGELEAYRFGRRGRIPSKGDWERVEQLHYRLNSLIPPEDRQKYQRYTQSVPLDVILLSTALMLCALLSLTGAAHPGTLVGLEARSFQQVGVPVSPNPRSVKIFDAAVWCFSLGALGAIANISLNVLLVQSDIKFDITRRKLVYLRLMIGALFGLIISLPASWPGFDSYTNFLADAARIPNVGAAVSLLLPFTLGFSTALILSLMERISRAVGDLFGCR